MKDEEDRFDNHHEGRKYRNRNIELCQPISLVSHQLNPPFHDSTYAPDHTNGVAGIGLWFAYAYRICFGLELNLLSYPICHIRVR